MLEAQIPKDIRKYESKFILMFTIKQTICEIIACTIALILYNVLKDVIGKTPAAYVCAIVSIPEVLIGWVKFQGIPFERFVQTAFISHVIAPRVRKYEIKQPYRKALTPLNVLSEKEYKKTFKIRKDLAKKNPDFTYYT